PLPRPPPSRPAPRQRAATPASSLHTIPRPYLPRREDNGAEWIEEMKQEWQHDVAVLKAWVANAEKK
ncbi:hypothetical protein C9F09_20325, partial [Salmonella enterica subsp. enterica serovar Wilhelmsburg]